MSETMNFGIGQSNVILDAKQLTLVCVAIDKQITFYQQVILDAFVAGKKNDYDTALELMGMLMSLYNGIQEAVATLSVETIIELSDWSAGIMASRGK